MDKLIHTTLGNIATQLLLDNFEEKMIMWLYKHEREIDESRVLKSVVLQCQ